MLLFQLEEYLITSQTFKKSEGGKKAPENVRGSAVVDQTPAVYHKYTKHWTHGIGVNLMLIMHPQSQFKFQSLSCWHTLQKKKKKKKFPFGRSNTSVSRRTEENNALAHREEAEASRVFTQRHSLNQPGYKVLSSFFFTLLKKKIKIKYQRGFATVAAAPCCSVGTGGKVRLAQKSQ